MLRPAKEFNRALSQLVDEDLLPMGWSRGKGLQWFQTPQSWAKKIIEFQPLKSGVGIKWGLQLSFVPIIREKRKVSHDLHLSYDPLDYQRDVAPWALSRFSTDESSASTLMISWSGLSQRLNPWTIAVATFTRWCDASKRKRPGSLSAWASIIIRRKCWPTQPRWASLGLSTPPYRSSKALSPGLRWPRRRSSDSGKISRSFGKRNLVRPSRRGPDAIAGGGG